ncbi:MAG: PA0069 family radical SAM protein [Wenzhouxiangellaceae bacterium]
MDYWATSIKGRGALSNPAGRFETVSKVALTDEQGEGEPMVAPVPVELPATVVKAEPVRTIISSNNSPDIPFRLSINPYRGCEHGCIYCYARPSHGYLNLSAGLDFETRLFYKQGAAEALEQQLRRPGYRCEPITLGANTDPYQPVEKKLGITRSLLQVMQRYGQPVTIITKSALVERDLDLLTAMAAEGLAQVMVSITSLSNEIKRTLEPRAASPAARLSAIGALAEAGVPVGVMAAPVIPAITDRELELILQRAAERGASRAGYILLRLPHEVKDLFREWLQAHYPMRASHVMSLIRQSRGGRDYDSRFGVRMRGEGHFADLIAHRFDLACKRLGLNAAQIKLNQNRFIPPLHSGDQMDLF